MSAFKIFADIVVGVQGPLTDTFRRRAIHTSKWHFEWVFLFSGYYVHMLEYFHATLLFLHEGLRVVIVGNEQCFIKCDLTACFSLKVYSLLIQTAMLCANGRIEVFVISLFSQVSLEQTKVRYYYT